MLREVSYDDSQTLSKIGRLRYDVWEGEDSIARALFPDKCWIDSMDTIPTAKHWIITDEDDDAGIVAAARLTIHYDENDDYRDIKLWREKGVTLKFPVCDLGRL